ncbi:unnamed protein product [Didymodactylos carnosus]|uniref:F-box domain-containing protein n=1 Tax=Didymodactylos carnosus TaxID=1234261 RepID=A0A815FMU3_9BILA|nr:unnamed protein product [Didymodactylos carnosus]CAF4178587.1 unnamed protein product [Didymodactylos carnosus]
MLGDLSNEILLITFEHLPITARILSFYNLKSRLNSLIEDPDTKIDLDLSVLTKHEFDFCCSIGLPIIVHTHIKSLTLSNERTFGAVELLLSMYDIEHIFTKLTRLKLFKLILPTPSQLERIQNKLKYLTQLSYFLIKTNALYNYTDIQHIIRTTIFSNSCNESQLIQFTSLKLTHLILTIGLLNFEFIEWLLKQCLQLQYLSLTFNGKGKLIDGKQYEKLLISLSELKRVHFDIINDHISYTREELNIFAFSFQTRFWIEHEWFIQCDHDRINSTLHYYSRPLKKQYILPVYLWKR